jgi:hypothetical protein
MTLQQKIEETEAMLRSLTMDAATGQGHRARRGGQTVA